MPAEVLPASQNLKAAGLATLGFAAFSGSDATVKLLAEGLAVPQIAFMVTGFALVITLAGALVLEGPAALLPRQPGIAFLRGALLAADTLLIYYAFARLDLAEAYVLAFLTPALVALMAVLLLGERLSRAGWLGILTGFTGVMVALRPGAEELNAGHAAALASALVFALTFILLRRIRRAESDVALLVVLLGVLNLLALAMILVGGGFQPVGGRELFLAALAGAALALGHLLVIRAGRSGAVSIVAPFQYSQIVWAGLYGLVLFGTPVEPQVAIGAGIIILSGWLVLR